MADRSADRSGAPPLVDYGWGACIPHTQAYLLRPLSNRLLRLRGLQANTRWEGLLVSLRPSSASSKRISQGRSVSAPEMPGGSGVDHG